VHDGNAYLVDFGSVKSAIAPSRESLATSVGTFGYMPPEQIMGRAVPASDVFSLAMTFIALGSHSDPSLLPLDNSSGQVDVRRILGHLPRAIVDVLEEMTAMGLEKRLGIAQFVIDRLVRPVSASRSTSPKTSRDADHSHNAGKISAIRMKPSGRLISMIGGGLLILIVILFSSSGSDSETKQGGSVTKNPVPVQKENTPKVKAVRLLTHIPSATLRRILTATEWTGHDGQNEARLVFKNQGVSVTGELTEWDRRKKEFSGQRTAVAVQITDQGTLWMTARRINEGVTIDDTFYGNLTEDSLMITGTGEKLYRQSGSEYTTEFKWQFKRSIP
jgi:serine/threonine protein kinase